MLDSTGGAPADVINSRCSTINLRDRFRTQQQATLAREVDAARAYPVVTDAEIVGRSNMRLRRAYLAGALVAIGVAVALRNSPSTAAQGGRKMPTYKVDPFWPKPLPSTKDVGGLSHQWVTGEVGA